MAQRKAHNTVIEYAGGSAGLRAACYLRVSTDDQAEHGVSLDVQERECRARAAELGAASVTVYRDEGISGMKWDRPGLQCLLTDLPRIDLLVVWAKDRLTRDLQHLLSIITSLAEHGVRLVAIKESVITDTAEGILSLQITGALSEYHPRKTAENVKAAMRRIAESGRHPSGSVFGYARNKEGNLVPDPVEAPIVSGLFRQALAGASVNDLVRHLNTLGVPCKKNGRSWQHCRVRYMLANATYVGEVNWGDVSTLGTHLALVSREDFDAVQELIATRSTNHGKKLHHYVPLIRCGICGGHLNTSNQYRGQENVAYYLCARRSQFDNAHPTHCIAERVAAAMIYRHTELLLSGAELAGAVAAVRRDLASPPPNIPTDIRLQLSDLARRRRVNLQALQDGLITQDDFGAANKPLVAREEELRAELDTTGLRSVLSSLEALLVRPIPELLANMRALPIEQQVVILRGIYPRIELHKGYLLFHHAGELVPPAKRPIPHYYSPKRGCVSLGF